MVVALAGRRIDRPQQHPPRFPLDRVPAVRGRLREALRRLEAQTLVVSAACGADLIALDVADELAIPYVVVLPVAPAEFKRSSVVDRPGDWGALFDRIMASAQHADRLVIAADPPDEPAYERANEAVLSEARDLAVRVRQGVSAVVVWDGRGEGRTDYTADFADAARRRGIALVDVPILGPTRPPDRA